MIGAVVGALLSTVAAAALRAAGRGRRFQDRMEATWAKVADAVGGRLEVVSRPTLAPRVLRLIAVIDDVEAIAVLGVPVDEGAPTHTKARALYVLGVGPIFEGDDGSLLSAARTLVESLPMNLGLRADGREVEVAWDGAEKDGDVLRRALLLVATVARQGADHLRELATIDGATYEASSEEGPRVRVRRGLSEIRIVVELRGGRTPVHVAKTRARPGTPELVARIEKDGATPALPAGALDADGPDVLVRVAPARIASDGQTVEISWTEAPDREQVEAAVKVLAAVGTSQGAQGAFR